MQQKNKVSIIGIGRLGLSFALLLDSKGYDVCGCDVNEKYVESLKDKTFTSDEPEINELLQKCNITFTTQPGDAFNFSEIIFIFVPTPSKESGEYDHQYIEQVISEYEKMDIFGKLIAIGCTVMPGYCSTLKKRLYEFGTRVVYNPFFIAQGSICNDLRNADIILVGGRMPQYIRDIHSSIMDTPPNFKILSLTGAEIAKISLNCFLTTKISFANRIGEICINSGIEDEVAEVLNTIGSDKRIGNLFLKFGFGFSGVCLPRDNRALGIHASSVGVTPQFQETIDETNFQHLQFLYKYFINKNPNKNIPFVFYQLSYKKDVSILTESQPLKLCLLFLKDGYKVSIVESESVVEQTKVLFEKYGDKVSYVEEKGFIINL